LGFVIKIEVRERSALPVPNYKTGGLFFDRPGRRETVRLKHADKHTLPHRIEVAPSCQHKLMLTIQAWLQR
jgi:hypothetical protein